MGDVWPPMNASLHPESGYSHQFNHNGGSGEAIDESIGLYQTWQFSLYKHVMNRLAVSEYRTRLDLCVCLRCDCFLNETTSCVVLFCLWCWWFVVSSVLLPKSPAQPARPVLSCCRLTWGCTPISITKMASLDWAVRMVGWWDSTCARPPRTRFIIVVFVLSCEMVVAYATCIKCDVHFFAIWNPSHPLFFTSLGDLLELKRCCGKIEVTTTSWSSASPRIKWLALAWRTSWWKCVRIVQSSPSSPRPPILPLRITLVISSLCFVSPV